MIYYVKIEDEHSYELLRQASIKTEKQLVVLSNSIWRECKDNGRSTGAYIVFYQGVPIDNFTHIPGPFAKSSAKRDYNAACTVGMAIAHSIIINIKFLKKDTYEVP